MITTRRAENGTSESYSQNSRQGTMLLEREVSKTSAEFDSVTVESESYEAQKARMQKNLDKLLNYDRYTETVQVETEQSQTVEDRTYVADETASQVSAYTDNEDIRPTSTTMQFGEGDVEQMYKEMDSSAAKETYRLNGKGKLFIVLYGLAVAVILALIIINTGVLVSLGNQSEQKAAELNSLVNEYNSLYEEKESISSDDYIIGWAEDNEMIFVPSGN